MEALEFAPVFVVHNAAYRNGIPNGRKRRERMQEGEIHDHYGESGEYGESSQNVEPNESEGGAGSLKPGDFLEKCRESGSDGLTDRLGGKRGTGAGIAASIGLEPHRD